MSLYDTLQVVEEASADEIRAAYLRLVQQHHPDRHVGEANAALRERFKEIQQAYEVLHDPERREAYDRQLSIPKPKPRAHPANARPNGTATRQGPRPLDPSRRRDVPDEWLQRGQLPRRKRPMLFVIFLVGLMTLAVLVVPECSREFEKFGSEVIRPYDNAEEVEARRRLADGRGAGGEDDVAEQVMITSVPFQLNGNSDVHEAIDSGAIATDSIADSNSNDEHEGTGGDVPDTLFTWSNRESQSPSLEDILSGALTDWNASDREVVATNWFELQGERPQQTESDNWLRIPIDGRSPTDGPVTDAQMNNWLRDPKFSTRESEADNRDWLLPSDAETVKGIDPDEGVTEFESSNWNANDLASNRKTPRPWSSANSPETARASESFQPPRPQEASRTPTFGLWKNSLFQNNSIGIDQPYPGTQFSIHPRSGLKSLGGVGETGQGIPRHRIQTSFGGPINTGAPHVPSLRSANLEKQPTFHYESETALNEISTAMTQQEIETKFGAPPSPPSIESLTPSGPYIPTEQNSFQLPPMFAPTHQNLSTPVAPTTGPGTGTW